MQLLLDTHLFLWWITNDRRLSKKARTLIQAADNVYISSVSLWEAAIKIQLGKLTASMDTLIESITTEGFIELPLTAKQTAKLLQLPNLHRDPFDRMLIAQAINEPLRLLTADKALQPYTELVELV